MLIPYISFNTVLNILILRCIGITDKRMSALLRMKHIDLFNFINSNIRIGRYVYFRNFLLIDFIHILYNSLDSKQELIDMITVCYLYSNNPTIIITAINDFVISMPRIMIPRTYHEKPLFTVSNFEYLWFGKIPIISLN